MREIISFPGLGLEFNIDRVAFTIGGIAIYWYGILIALGFLLGILYTFWRVKEFGLDGDRVVDVILGGTLLGIVGARLYYVAFQWDAFRDDLSMIFKIRYGGIAIYGGIIGALLGGMLLCRWRRVKLLPTLDLIAGGMLLGQAVGRWGNFVNAEAFGSNTAMPWGMTSVPTIQNYLRSPAVVESLSALGVQVDPAQPVHPTFFYESMWCLLGFLFLAFFTKRRRYDGQMALLYLGWYSLGRFFIEGLRTDSLLLGSLRVSQMLALLCVIGSALALVVIHSRIRRSNDPGYLPLYVNTEEGRAVLAGTFYPAKGKKGGEARGAEESEEAGGAQPEENPAGPESGGAEQGADALEPEGETAGEESGSEEGADSPEEA